MPRPRTIDDDAVLDAAADLVGRIGPAGLTLARVGDEVGLSAATLVQRFGSKRGLLLAMTERAAAGWPERIAAARARTGSPLDALIGALRDMTSGVRTPEAMANSVAFLQVDLSDPEFHARTRAGMDAMRGAIAELIDEAVARGELAGPIDAPALANTVLTVYNGALITWAIMREGELTGWLERELRHALGVEAESLG
jgi:AcrR family transcriptional regulator